MTSLESLLEYLIKRFKLDREQATVIATELYRKIELIKNLKND